MQQAKRPECWKCGYDLSGLRVDGACPECGTPVWSRPESTLASPDAQSSLVWGIVSICLFFACIGPLAGFVAIPAVVKGNRVMEDVRTGRVPASAAGGGRAGRILGWITIALSVGVVVLYGVMLASMMVF